MAYRNSAYQSMLTTGLPIESIVMIRDHVGNCFDASTMTTLEWGFLPITQDEPNTTIDMEQGQCIMPTCERWHCLMTEAEKVTSPGLHLLDWQPYQKSWGDEYLSMRHAETNPPEKPLTLSEWLGTKIWQVATLPPIHPSAQESGEPQESRKWNYSPSGFSYLGDQETREDDRSRTPLQRGKGKGDLKESAKGKGLGKKGMKSGKTIGSPEGEEGERIGRKYFSGPATLPKSWRERKPDEIIMSGSIWCSNRGRIGLPYLGEHGYLLMHQ